MIQTQSEELDFVVKNNEHTMARNFKEIPIVALRQKGRLLLSRLLNPIKILPSEEGLPRDWRGIAHLAGLQSVHGSMIASQPDPIAKILQLWCQEGNKETATLGQLQKFLEIIDRWDVMDDMQECLVEDAEHYLSSRQKKAIQEEIPVENFAKPDNNILTQDDVLRAQEGLPPQLYDAFVLFADEDIDFASELIERMENFGFKLCVKERDLIGGISFEHEAILRLISERCNRLIVIVSPSFVKSPANAFFVNFAQALGIEQGRRKIVPCLYEKCMLPATLNYYFLLNYQRSGKLWNFWDKLKDSLRNTSSELNNRITLPSITVTEVDQLSLNRKELTNYCGNKSPQSEKCISLGIEASTSTFKQTSNCCKDNQEESTHVQIMPPSPRIRNSTSMVNLDTEEDLPSYHLSCDKYPSALTINNDEQIVRQHRKKAKWYRKILHSHSANSLSDDGVAKTKTKRKWFGKKLLAT